MLVVLWFAGAVVPESGLWGRNEGKSGRPPAYAITIELPKRQRQCPCEHRPAELGAWSKVGSGSLQGGASSSCHLVTGRVQASNKQQAIATSTPPLRRRSAARLFVRRIHSSPPENAPFQLVRLHQASRTLALLPRRPHKTSRPIDRDLEAGAFHVDLDGFRSRAAAARQPSCRELRAESSGNTNTEHHIVHHRPSIAASISPSPPSWHSGYHAPSW